MKYHLDINYGYLVTKNARNEAKAHNIHFVLDPVTKAICLVSNKSSDIINHIRSNHGVVISYFNPKLGKYNRLTGTATMSGDMLCDFEKTAFETLNPQAKKGEALVYVEMTRFEILNSPKAPKPQHVPTKIAVGHSGHVAII